MLHPPANFRRFVASATAAVVVRCPGRDGGLPAAHAADGRELLAGAIANTRGRYLVYNFGGGNPAPMLNAGGQLVRDGQRRPPDDHQVRVAEAHAAAARRLPLRLSVPLRTRSPARAPAKGCGRPPRSTRRCRPGRRSASRPSRSTPTSSTFAARRAAPGRPPAAVRRWAPTSTTPAARAGPTPPSRAPSPTRASRRCPAATRSGRRCRR